MYVDDELFLRFITINDATHYSSSTARGELRSVNKLSYTPHLEIAVIIMWSSILNRYCLVPTTIS